MKHSFLSISHSRNKGSVKSMAMEYDAANTDTISPSAPHSVVRTRAGESAKGSDLDLTTGKCMTCDSMVRWPKELTVFRCSVCATVNDLTPIGRSENPESCYSEQSTRGSTPSQRCSSSFRGRTPCDQSLTALNIIHYV